MLAQGRARWPICCPATEFVPGGGGVDWWGPYFDLADAIDAGLEATDRMEFCATCLSEVPWSAILLFGNRLRWHVGR